MFDTMVETVEKYEIGEISGDEAADYLFGVIRNADFVPTALGWKDPDKRFISPSMPDMVRFMTWATTKAPPEIKELGRGTLRSMVSAAVHGKRLV